MEISLRNPRPIFVTKICDWDFYLRRGSLLEKIKEVRTSPPCLLFSYCLVGQHSTDHFQHIGSSHGSLLLTQHHHTGLVAGRCHPGGQHASLIGISLGGKIA